jgi:hypothetical protein
MHSMVEIVSVLFTKGIPNTHGSSRRQDTAFHFQMHVSKPPGDVVTIRKEKPRCPEALSGAVIDCTKARRKMRKKMAEILGFGRFGGQNRAAADGGWGPHCCRFVAHVAFAQAAWP